MKTLILISTVLLTFCLSVKAQIYSYTDATSGAPATVSAHMTGSNLTRVNGATAPLLPCSSGFSSTNFGNTTTYNPTFINYKGVEITLTPDPSYKLTITSFSADIRRSGSGPAYLRFAYSTNGGLTWTDQGSNQSPYNGFCGSTVTGTWDMPDFSSMNEIKLVIYGFNASGTAGVLQLLNVEVFGSLKYIDDDWDDYGAEADCDDWNETIFPGALEMCNDKDEDCDGVINNFPSKQWSAEYNENYLLDVRLLPNGKVITLSSKYNYFNSFVFLTQYSSTGSTDWVRSLFENNDYNYAIDFEPTTDGGYVITGHAYPDDYIESTYLWIIKTDAEGIIQWQRNIGGSSAEYSRRILQTPDGGYLVGGYTYSTDIVATGNHGGKDALIAKLDMNGNVQWTKLIGGSGDDELRDFAFCTGGGYLVGCETTSTDGDALGNNGLIDMLITKLDDSGNILWSRTLGSSGNDYLRALVVTSAGACIGGGNVNNGDGNVTGYHGEDDEWVFKLTPSGNLEWQHTLGGSDKDVFIDIISDPDGNFLITGTTRSSDGNLTGTIPNDYKKYIVKMDESGNTLWSTSFGSSPSQSIEFATTAYAKGKWAFIWRASIEKAAVTSLTESGTIEWTKYWVPGSHFWSPQFLGLQLIDGNEDGKLVVGADIEDYVLGYFPFIIARIQTTPETVYADTDGDGFGSALDSIVLTCGTIPSGYAAQKTDCNDGNAAIHPGAAEVCNNLDDNCNGEADDNPTASISPSGNVTICKGSALTLTANAGTGFTYQWLKNGANITGATLQTYSPTKTASYSVKESNSFGCTATSFETNLSVLDPVAAIIPLGNLNICATGSVELQANPSSGASYQWYKGDLMLTGATNNSYTASSKGTYKVAVIDINTGCGKTSSGVKVTKNCKLAGEELLEFSIYPNPASSSFTVTVSGEISDAIPVLEIHNALGQIIMNRQLEAGYANMNLSVEIPAMWSNGLYFVSIKTGLTKVVRPLQVSR